MFCRKKAKLAEKLKAEEFDDKIFMDDDDLQAPPLDSKEPLDKQRLLIVAWSVEMHPSVWSSDIISFWTYLLISKNLLYVVGSADVSKNLVNSSL